MSKLLKFIFKYTGGRHEKNRMIEEAQSDVVGKGRVGYMMILQ